ncbi:MAG: hypothetical protein ABJ360_02830 [Roseobacter sp.]
MTQTTLTDELTILAPPKTWSLVVTILGDTKGQAIAGKDLRALMTDIGIKAEALRVALHRLKKDGWIDTTMSGREASYALSDYGRRETARVYDDIYRTDMKYPEGWHVVMPPIQDSPAPAAISLSKSTILVPRSIPLPKDALVMTLPDAPLPGWVQDQLVPSHLTQLAAGLTPLVPRFATAPDAITSRLLFLHHWRKLALNDGVWAHIGLCPDGTLAQCHKAVTGLLSTRF